MTKEEFALRLNGREIGNELSAAEELEAKEHGLVVCFGASDDLLEFEGAITEETGTEAHFIRNKYGDIDVMDESKIAEIKELIEEANIKLDIPSAKITAQWDAREIDASWLITPHKLPHATFDIMEDGALFCRGAVIAIKDIEEALE